MRFKLLLIIRGIASSFENVETDSGKRVAKKKKRGKKKRNRKVRRNYFENDPNRGFSNKHPRET